MAYVSYSRISDFRFDDGGAHAIAAGMHWNPTDVNTILLYSHPRLHKLKKAWKPVVANLDFKKEQWDRAVRKEKTLFNFLKSEIYEK